jgi:membrane protein YqaA with SNARE-associated domain
MDREGGMEAFFIELGYFGLFIIAFISATLIPAATEVFMVAMTALGYSFVGMLLIATAGNVLGAVFNYSLGWRGMDFLARTRFCPSPKILYKIQTLFKRWGTVALFFSWLPFIGDPMTVAAGLARIPLRTFMPWVLTGRLLRYVAVLALGETALKFFS